MPVRSEVRRPSPAEPATGRGTAADIPTDLLAFAALLVPTALFGRDFAQVSVPGTPIYITEVMLLVIAGLAMRRHGWRETWALVKARLPLVAVGVFVLAGAIAAARGLVGYGFGHLIRDIGLVVYVVVLPIAVLVADDRRRLWLLVKVMVFAGGAGVALWTLSYAAAVLVDVHGVPRPRGGSAAGLYMSLPVLWVAARLAYDLPVRRPEVAVAVTGLVAMGLTTQRANWLAIAAALALLIALAPARRRLRTAVGAAAAVLFMAAATVGIEAAASIGGAQTPDQHAEGEQGPATPRPSVPSKPSDIQAAKEVRGLTGGQSSEGSNADWRLAIWGYSLERMVESPLGISLGRPLEFVWNDRLYDFRTGDEKNEQDVTGPHNSFVEVGARMGVAGLIALVALVAIAAWRGLSVVRDRSLPPEARFLGAALLSMLAAAVVITLLNDALKGPYHAVFVWLLVALLLIAPAVVGRARPDASAR